MKKAVPDDEEYPSHSKYHWRAMRINDGSSTNFGFTVLEIPDSDDETSGVGAKVIAEDEAASLAVLDKHPDGMEFISVDEGEDLQKAYEEIVISDDESDEDNQSGSRSSSRSSSSSSSSRSRHHSSLSSRSSSPTHHQRSRSNSDDVSEKTEVDNNKGKIFFHFLIVVHASS